MVLSEEPLSGEEESTLNQEGIGEESTLKPEEVNEQSTPELEEVDEPSTAEEEMVEGGCSWSAPHCLAYPINCS